MIEMKDILKIGNPVLNQISKSVKLPMNDENHKLISNLMQYVYLSQDEKSKNMYGLRPAVGIAAPQVGVNLRIFACLVKDEHIDFNHVFVNPVITYKSKEMVYLDNGEGCLSIDYPTEGVVLRHLLIKVNTYVYNFKTKKLDKIKLTLSGYPSIVFQHEFDHLDGIIYTDKLVNLSDDIEAISLSEYESSLYEE